MCILNKLKHVGYLIKIENKHEEAIAINYFQDNKLLFCDGSQPVECNYFDGIIGFLATTDGLAVCAYPCSHYSDITDEFFTEVCK